MLTLNINDKEEKFHIGCRTFISLYELLHKLETTSDRSFQVCVNSQSIEPGKYMEHMISNGDKITVIYT